MVRLVVEGATPIRIVVTRALVIVDHVLRGMAQKVHIILLSVADVFK